MSGTRLERVEALFHAALDLPEAERDTYLSGATEDDALRAEVAALLRRHADDDAPLQAALHGAVLQALPPAPDQVGAYRVQRELGAGGMGTVYLAEREVGGLRQQVAVKLVRGYATAQARERLLREHALLAGLNHPHIAGFIDGGETADGQPYLVMEYVDGQSLAGYCAAHALDLPARLRLFLPLCRAVQHAHQRLILHRDIKPANVLVRADGTPVLLDFGIGKLIDGTDPDATATRVFTPAYAAPEQRRGRGVTTAADVYGLGCVLFELLTDRAVADVAGAEGLPPPSRCAAPARARQLRGDLDTLVGKAAHLEPERRYATAQALADDVENFLAGRPLAAAPDSLGYRTVKFLRRHRVAASAALLLALGLAAFVWRLDAERQRALAAEGRAEREAMSTRRSRDFLVSLFEAASPDNTLGQPLSARALIDRGRERAAADLAEEPESAARLALVIAEVYSSLGDPQASVQTAEAALPLVAGDDEGRALLRADLLQRLGQEYDNLDRGEDSARALAQSLALRRRYAPADAAPIAGVLIDRALLRNHGGDYDAARADLDEALRLLAPLPAAATASLRTNAQIGLAENARLREDYAAALHHVGLAEAAAHALPARSPERREIWRMKAQAQIGLGEPAAAAATLREALAALRASVGEHSTAVGNVENDLATALSATGDYRGMIEHLEAALRIFAAARPDDPAATAVSRLNLGSAWESLGDFARSERYMRGALADLERFTPDDPAVLTARTDLAQTLSLAGQHAEARALIANVLAARAAGGDDTRIALALAQFRAARIELRAGAPAPAATMLQQAFTALDPLLPAAHPVRAQFARSRGQLALARGDLAEARHEYAAAIAQQAAVKGGDPVALAEMRAEYAEVLRQAGDAAAAAAALAIALPVLDADLLEISPTRQRAHATQARLREAVPAPGS